MIGRINAILEMNQTANKSPFALSSAAPSARKFLREFDIEGKNSLTMAERHQIDRMLDDYKNSSVAMDLMASKLAILQSDTDDMDAPALDIILSSNENQKNESDLTDLIECLLTDEVPLHSKIATLTQSLFAK